HSTDYETLSSESITVLENTIDLQWPPITGWRVTPNRRPCQLTKDMLDSHQRIPYPPMIKLKIQPTTFNLRSTEVPVEIVGIREARKTFILNPKLRPGTSLSSPTSSGPFSPPLQSPQTPLTQSLATTRSLSSSSSLSDTATGAPKLDDVISRKSLAEIAKKITHWEPLGPYLYLTRPQEEEIVQKYRDYGMQKREFLEVWKVMKGEGATYRALITATEEAEDRQLADCVRSLLEK
ncbi:hypothetical protein GBAR_LOCUS27719, partial [Geodia barretti]